MIAGLFPLIRRTEKENSKEIDSTGLESLQDVHSESNESQEEGLQDPPAEYSLLKLLFSSRKKMVEHFQFLMSSSMEVTGSHDSMWERAEYVFSEVRRIASEDEDFTLESAIKGKRVCPFKSHSCLFLDSNFPVLKSWRVFFA